MKSSEKLWGTGRASDDPAVARVFEAQYVETLKSKQVTHAWLGAGVGLFVVLAAAILL